jgi:hypothetical protein
MPASNVMIFDGQPDEERRRANDGSIQDLVWVVGSAGPPVAGMSPFMDQDQPPEAVGSLHGYITSTNYELLFHLAKRQSVVCEVDFIYDLRDIDEVPQRDICKTRYSAHLNEHHVVARGNTYLFANSLKEFSALCKHNNLQWVVPSFLLRGVNSFGDNSLDLDIERLDAEGLQAELQKGWELRLEEANLAAADGGPADGGLPRIDHSTSAAVHPVVNGIPSILLDDIADPWMQP